MVCAVARTRAGNRSHPFTKGKRALAATGRARSGLALLLVGIGVPMAPAFVAEASQVGGKGTAGALLVIGDRALGLRDLALQLDDRLLGLPVPLGRGDLAHGEARRLERLQLGAVLLQLDPVPG